MQKLGMATQKVAIGDRAIWLDVPDYYLIGAEEDGTVWAVATETNPSFCFRFSVLTVTKKPDERTGARVVIDLAADLVEEGKKENFQTFRIGNKAWREDLEHSTDEEGRPILVHFWIVGFGERKAIISLTCEADRDQDAEARAAIASVPGMIESLEERPQKSPLTRFEESTLEEEREFILSVLRERYDTFQLPKLGSDLHLLQRAIDEDCFRPEDEVAWAAAGTVFGDVLAAELSLEWINYSDDYGCDPALNRPGTEIVLYPRSMLIKRVEKGDAINLAYLLEALAEQIKELG